MLGLGAWLGCVVEGVGRYLDVVCHDIVCLKEVMKLTVGGKCEGVVKGIMG